MEKFELILEDDDMEMAFEESKKLKKQLMFADLDEDEDEELVVKQKRKELAEDEAGGLMEALLQVACSGPVVMKVASIVATYLMKRWQKKPENPSSITIKTAEGHIITIDQSVMEKSGNDVDSFVNNIASIIKLGQSAMD